MNSWDDPGFRAAIEATGKKNILVTGLWTEAFAIRKGNGNALKRVCWRSVEPGEIDGVCYHIPQLIEATT
jgi:hypothetical protein